MSEQDYKTNNLSNNQTDLNGNMSGEPAAEWVAEPTPPPAAAANEPAEERAAGSDPSEASGEPAAEWVAEPSLAQPGYAAYGRPDGYEDNYRFRSGAGDAYMPNVGSSGSDLANTAAAAEQSAAAGSAAAAAGTAAATGAAARAASAGSTVTPPPAAPRVRPETPRRRPGVGWTVLMILLALLAGYLGALLQTKHITAKVTDGITNDIQAYMEEAGATVMYRSVNTQTESGDAAIDVASVAELGAVGAALAAPCGCLFSAMNFLLFVVKMFNLSQLGTDYPARQYAICYQPSLSDCWFYCPYRSCCTSA